MPTLHQVHVFGLGIRLRQALILTLRRPSGESQRPLHGIIGRLLQEIEALKKSPNLSTDLQERLQQLRRLSVHFRRALGRGGDDRHIQCICDDFHEQLDMLRESTLSSLEQGTPAFSNLRSWFALGAAIPSGRQDPRSRPNGTERRSYEWHWDQPDSIDTLLAAVGVGQDVVFPGLAPIDSSSPNEPDFWDDLPVELAGWHRIEAGLASLTEAAEPESHRGPDLLTKFQRKIIDALDGRALKKEQLAAELKCEPSRLYKNGGLKELKERRLVDNKAGVGYYRPDAPPPALKPPG